MGGEIKVSSVPDVGSRFAFRSPLLDAALPTPPVPSAKLRSGQRLQGLRVLAVEDNEVNRLVLAELLGGEGANLLCVEDGQQALDRLIADGERAWDILLTELQMPVMDGFAVTQNVRKFGMDLPIVGLNAHAMPEDRATCLAAGMVDHLSKPFELEGLVEVILLHARQSPLASAGRTLSLVPISDTAARSASVCSADFLQVDLPNREVSKPLTRTPVVVDWSALEACFQDKGPFVTRLAASLIESYRNTPDLLRRAAKDNDAVALGFAAHSIKGIAGNLMAHGLHEIAQKAIQAANEGRSDLAGLALLLADGWEEVLSAAEQRTRSAGATESIPLGLRP